MKIIPVKMGNLFGRKKESRVTEHDKAVLVSHLQHDYNTVFEKCWGQKHKSEVLDGSGANHK